MLKFKLCNPQGVCIFDIDVLYDNEQFTYYGDRGSTVVKVLRY
jgi:hypothetical protein